MNDQKFVKVSDLFRCETCFHTSHKGCALGAFACDLGEAYRPSMSLLPALTLDDLRPQGRWVIRGGKRYCSHCGERACVTRDKEDFWYTTDTKFCSECGADMRGGGEDA